MLNHTQTTNPHPNSALERCICLAKGVLSPYRIACKLAYVRAHARVPQIDTDPGDNELCGNKHQPHLPTGVSARVRGHGGNLRVYVLQIKN